MKMSNFQIYRFLFLEHQLEDQCSRDLRTFLQWGKAARLCRPTLFFSIFAGVVEGTSSNRNNFVVQIRV